jgi:hypothetical protein
LCPQQAVQQRNFQFHNGGKLWRPFFDVEMIEDPEFARRITRGDGSGRQDGQSGMRRHATVA